jgi:MFS family permease
MMTRTIDTTETAGFRRNLTVLILAQSLGAASGPIVISLGGLVGQDLATDPALATLPVSIYNLGLALGTVPAAWIMRQYGRRSGYLLGAMIGVLSGLVAAGAISFGAFIFFCLGTFLAGLYASYVQSYRFAAADGREGAANPQRQPKRLPMTEGTPCSNFWRRLNTCLGSPLAWCLTGLCHSS